jgi:hypothetical protein
MYTTIHILASIHILVGKLKKGQLTLDNLFGHKYDVVAHAYIY